MLRLIKVDLASTRKPYLRNGAPSFFLHFRALDALLSEGSQFSFQIVTHEIEFVGTILIGRVECGFCRRQSEDQPAMTCIDGFEPEDVAEKCTVSVGILTIDNYVSPRNHLPLLRNARTSWHAVPWGLEDSMEIKFRTLPDLPSRALRLK
jgi:hypothetical protein